MASTRRELLTALLGSQVAQVACRGRRWSNEVDGAFIDPKFDAGHRLREPWPGSFGSAPTRSREVLILGGGVSGLAAGWRLRRAGVDDFTVLELEGEAGGTSLGGCNGLGGYPWGAHYLPAPRKDQAMLVELLDEMGLVWSRTTLGEPVYVEGALCASPQERVFAGGLWQEGLVPALGVEDGAAEAVLAFQHRVSAYAGVRGRDGRRAFALPMVDSSDDPEFLALDRLSFAEWLRKEGFEHPVVQWLANYATRDDFGADFKQTSAWYGLHYHASRMPSPGAPSAPFLTWPSGNFRLVRHLVARVTKDHHPSRPRLHTGRLVTRVRPHESGDGVSVEVLGPDGPERWLGRRVIWSMPSFLKPHVLEGFPFGGASLSTSAWLVANVHLRTRPESRGFESAWDNVIYGSRSLGYVVSTHQLGPRAGPTTWTWYMPLIADEPAQARRWLMALDWKEAADLVLSDLEVAHQGLRHAVDRVDVRRIGHAMPRPEPGTRANPALRAAATPKGSLHFAHTDLSGVALFEEAFSHGVRAAEEVILGLGGAG